MVEILFRAVAFIFSGKRATCKSIVSEAHVRFKFLGIWRLFHYFRSLAI